MQPILSLENLSKYYTSAANVVVGLNAVNLNFRRGEFVAITGESGSGKSTLSNVLCGILGYESGEMLVEGRPTSHYDSSDWERYRRDNISYISQDYGLLPGATVLSNVVSALRLAGMEKAAANARAKEALQALDLWSLRRRRASRLSSGQKQRLSIARALAKPAPVLIADEPTGNLDPENSAKVIQLLAKAAESRLVLMVTHEFEEVKDHVTRHIRLQDGAVVVDTPLRPAGDPQMLPDAPLKRNPRMSGFVAGLQLRSRPVWTALMTMLFALTAFAVLAFMGSFVVALDDTNTKIYDPSVFINGDPNRIIVTRNDLKPMEPSDYEVMANMEFVESLERNGYVAEAQYAYRNGVDYTTTYKEVIYTVGMNVHHRLEEIKTVRADAPFLQLVPVLPQGQTFLKEGRLPEQFYEIVAHTASGYSVGDEVSVFLVNFRYLSRSAKLEFKFTVVGLTDHGSGLYFADDVGRFMQHVAHTHGNGQYYHLLPEVEQVELWKETYKDIPPESMPVGFSYTLQPGQCYVHKSVYISMKGDFGGSVQVPNINLEREGEDPLLQKNRVELKLPPQFWVTYEDPLTGEEISRRVALTGYHDTELFTRLLFVHQETFDQLCWNEVSEQVSLTIDHYAHTQQVLDKLTELGYIAASPYRLGAVEVDPEKAEHREQTLTICLLALLAVVVLQIVVVRALFGVQLDTYRLLRNIGLVHKSAKASVLWQFLAFMVLGQLLAALGLWYCLEKEIPQLTQIMVYLPAVTLAALSALHLATSMTAGLWTVRAMEKQVYPTDGGFMDLQMDEEVSV